MESKDNASTEGFIPFGKYRTYYRIVGEKTKKPPLILLHGGPGSTHNYFKVLDDVATLSQRQLIMYDQIGCGRSSIPDDEPNLYNANTWLDELENLINYFELKEFHLLGQSWGGMLAIMYLCDRNEDKIKSLILSSTLSSAKLWSRELHRLIGYLPANEQQAIKHAELVQDFKEKQYLEANAHFMNLHAGTAFPNSKKEIVKGTKAYMVAWGPNEYMPQGNLRNYEYTEKLTKIKTPTLIISGTDDLSTPLVSKVMADAISNSKWHLFEGSRHMPFVEENIRYKELLTSWLSNLV
ncbi:proline iminopeptidase [Liquorilactobacillus cacaonum]|uniref:Proline iminopeptidase n=1 Tax=Liquorilactobacillus cacaonum DSM 21116 TaxID=1423729 RepID=A0A0R2CN08_9LACO|nr:proline iminopeptidase-family hydrolase [Liquorilactobacillus cacaonum]KRM92666.1 proline iminopeptidase [Liquorilactobacillus cacaonum DSM 21116]